MQDTPDNGTVTCYDYDADELCVVCFDAPVDTTFTHGGTGHRACCNSCAARVFAAEQPCPICRQVIDGLVHGTPVSKREESKERSLSEVSAADTVFDDDQSIDAEPFAHALAHPFAADSELESEAASWVVLPYHAAHTLAAYARGSSASLLRELSESIDEELL